MNFIEQKILLFDELPEGDRAEVEAYLHSNRGAQALLDEGRALRRILSMGVDEAGEVGSEDVADYVVSRAMGEDLNTRFHRVEQAIRQNPELASIVTSLEENLSRMTANAEDPIAQFERLSGHAVSSQTSTRVSRANDRAAAPPAREMRLVHRRPMRLALAACIALVGLYGALWFAGSATTAEHHRIADLDEVSAAYEGPRFRGESSSTDIERYEEAVALLRDARTSTLGLFPSYDFQKLGEAEQVLKRIVESSDEPTFVSMEAEFVLGRIYVHQQRYGEATEVLEPIVERAGPRAGSAQRLLDYVAGRP
ncbi:MAG: hypothetical protein R3284_10640 [Rubricoccaceae bacterium]|nr:hypothetical protein [Rubricoccaceae bacterium]